MRIGSLPVFNRIFGVLLLTFFVWGTTFAQSYIPYTIPNLKLWYKSDSGIVASGAVATWNDISGNGYHATQNTVAKQPAVVQNIPLLNGKPVVRFDGTNDNLLVPNAALPTQQNTLFIVAANRKNANGWLFSRNLSAVGYRMIFVFAGGANKVGYANNSPITSTNAVDTGKFAVLEGLYDNTNQKLFVNGLQAATSAQTGTITYGANDLGSMGSMASTTTTQNFLTGDIAEVILYDRALTTAEAQQVRDYLYNKYAPPVSLGADVNIPYSLCPVTLNAGNRFVSYLWSTGQTTPQIQTTLSGTYWVRTTDVFGRISSDTVEVTVPSVKLNLNDTTICQGNTLTLTTALPVNTNYNYLWSNGQTGSSITASVAGNYHVVLTEIPAGCSRSSDTISVTVDNFASQVSLGPDTALCAGNRLGLASPATGWGSLNFNWSTLSTDTVIAINSTGNYSVTVTNASGCSATDTALVTIQGSAPTVLFNGDTICRGQIYQPINQSTASDPISGYLWNFGNGDTSTLANPVYTYLQAGAFSVTLKVTTAAGCTNTATRPVLVNALPLAAFAFQNGCINNPVAFTDLSTTPSGTTINQWAWSFGDNSNSNLQNPTHTYSTSNTFNVQLTVTNSQGCSNTAANNLNVVSSATLPTTPTLISPATVASLEKTPVNFTWYNDPYAVRFRIYVSTDSLFNTVQYTAIVTDTTYVLNTVTGSQFYYWKVVAYNLCSDSVTSPVRKFKVFSPSQIANMAVWFRADTGLITTAGPVSVWNDLSGLGNNATQNTVSRQPAKVLNIPTLNSKPVVRFTTDDYMLLPAAAMPTQQNTVFVVSANRANANGWLIGRNQSVVGYRMIYVFTGGQIKPGYANNTALSASSAVSLNRYSLLEGIYDNATQKIFLNGTLNGSATATGTITYGANDLAAMGCMASTTTTSNFLTGDIAEVILFHRALTTTEVQQVRDYIYNRYAPPVNLGPDITQLYKLCPVTLDASNRYVSYLWSTGETTSQINARTSGTYWVRTIDAFDRVSTDTVKVVVPYLGMNLTDTIICSYSSATILPQLSNSSYTFSWNTSANTQAISVNSSGNYLVTITDTTGCTFIGDTVNVQVDSIEFVNLISTTDTLLCAGNELKTASLSAYPGVIIGWSNGADTSQLAFTTPGVYTVEAIDANGCSVKDTVKVNIKTVAAPTMNWSAPPVCFGEITSFSSNSATDPNDDFKTWYWDFGDGQSSSLENPTHNYLAPGDYIVSLSVVTDSGCTGILTKVVTSSVPPIPGFTYPEVICAGTPVLLADQSAFLFGDSVTAWVWSVNGAVSSTAKNFTYEFPSQGSYEITLQAVSKSGCSDSVKETIDVFPTLKADFAYNSVCFGDSTAFTDLTGSLSIVDWQWTLGYSISAVETEQNPTHKYAAPGDYTVTLRVENAIGCVDYETKTVSIVQRPTAKFGNLIACEDQPYTPLDSSVVNNDTIAAWKWTMAGNNYNGQTPMHIFPDSGSYPVKLKVTTQKGCSDSVTRTVAVKPTPKALFTVTPLYGEAPVEISFINQSTGASSYLWNFGDANISTDAAPFHTYTANDTFNITLTATSAFGCMDSSSRTFIVAPTDLDIAVDKVTVTKKPQPDGSYLINVVADVSNVGTRLITNTLFYVTIGSGGVIAEEWDSVILSGYNAQVMFKAEFVVAAENANSYVCVKAVSVNNGETETRTDNNSQCASTEQTIQVIGPSPNPMSSNASVGIIVPKAGTVTIDIMDMAGQYVVKGEQVNVPKGRSEWQLPADKMRSAEYFLRLYYNDDIIVRKFIVAKQ